MIIRPVHLGDEVSLNNAINNSLELLKKWQPWANDPSIEATRSFVQRGVFAWDSYFIQDFPMVMIHKQDKKIIGASGYNDRSDTHQGMYEIGYWCDIPYQGNGYVTECTNALTRYAFDADLLCKAIEQFTSLQITVADHVDTFINIGVPDWRFMLKRQKVKGDNIYLSPVEKNLIPTGPFVKF